MVPCAQTSCQHSERASHCREEVAPPTLAGPVCDQQHSTCQTHQSIFSANFSYYPFFSGRHESSRVAASAHFQVETHAVARFLRHVRDDSDRPGKIAPQPSRVLPPALNRTEFRHFRTRIRPRSSRRSARTTRHAETDRAHAQP